jgi:hypothetical protein
MGVGAAAVSSRKVAASGACARDRVFSGARMRPVLVFALSFLAAGASAQPPTPVRVERCRANNPELAAAFDAIRAYDRLLRSARSETPVASLESAYRALVERRCLEPASHEVGGPRFESVAGLTGWWDGGGIRWLESYLQLPVLTVGRRADVPHVVLPNDEVPVIPPERLSASAGLSRVVCGDEPSCGAETRGWIERAERAFAAHADAETRRSGARDRQAAIATCAENARAIPRETRFIRWLDCVENEHPRRSAFPVARFRAPRTGWMVVRGRRGHHRFCDEVRAYDLATGSAYVAQSCTDLTLRQDGSVDHSSTDRSRTASALAGSVATDNLRETLLMLLLDPITVALAPDPFYVPLPPGMSTTWVEGASTFGSGQGTSWASSAQTQLAWAWVDGERVLAEGTLTWPDSHRAPEAHAAELLSIVDAGFTSGCPAVGPPPTLDGNRGRVSAIDADRDSLAALDVELTDRILRYRTPAACARTRMHRW